MSSIKEDLATAEQMVKEGRDEEGWEIIRKVERDIAGLESDGDDGEEQPSVAQRTMSKRATIAHPFETMVDGIADSEGVPRHVAMARARKRHPRLFSAYQEASSEATPTLMSKVLPQAVTDFQDAVDALARAHKIPRTQAMAKVRTQAPDLYKRFLEIN